MIFVPAGATRWVSTAGRALKAVVFTEYYGSVVSGVPETSCPCWHMISRHFECSDVRLPAAFSILYNLYGNAENASLHNSSLSVLTYVKT